MAKGFNDNPETVEAPDRINVWDPNSKRIKAQEIRATYRLLGEMAVALLVIRDHVVRDTLNDAAAAISNHLTRIEQ